MSEISAALQTVSELSERSSRRAVLRWALLGLICAGALGLHVWITRQGHALSPDSVSYLRIADGLSAGEGYGFRTVRGEFGTLIHWPPIYPALLWSVGLLGGGPRNAGAVLQTTLLIPNLLLLARVAFVIGGRSWGAALTCTTVTALSLESIRLHTAILSEPLFVCLVLSGILLFASALRGSCLRRLALSALVVSMAWLTRYAGAGIVLTLGVATLIAWRGTRWRRFGAASVFVGIASLPMTVWLAWGWVQTHSVANRQFNWHGAETGTLKSGLAAVGRWLAGTDFGSDDWGIALGITQMVMIVLACVWLRRRAGPGLELGMTCASAAAGYVVFLIISLCFFDAYTPLDFRTLFPAHVLTVPIVCGAFVPMIWEKRALLIRGSVGVACVLLIAGRAIPAVQWAKDATEDGLGYASASWKRSPLVIATRKLPDDAVIYSNRMDVVYVCSGRDGLTLARTHNPVNSSANPRLVRQLRTMREQVQEDDRCGLAVYAVLFKSGRNCVGVKELAERFDVETAGRYKDGAIVRLRPKRATTQPVTSARR